MSFQPPPMTVKRIALIPLLTIRGATAPKILYQLKWLMPQGALWLAKRLSLNLNFSFFNRNSLLLESSSYPIVLTRLGGPRSRPYTSRKISRVLPGIEPGTSWVSVRWANHYTKQAVLIPLLLCINGKLIALFCN